MYLTETQVYEHKINVMWSGVSSLIILFDVNVTGPEKTGLIYTKYTYSYYGAYLFFCVCYLISVSCIKFLRILRIYDEICVIMLCCHVEILHLKG